MFPSANYVAILDIKAVIRKWQDHEISDNQALEAIKTILNHTQVGSGA